jgi:ribose-phosphate pyrophosphokinase
MRKTTLDLTNLERSEIKYNISKFPDGQQTIVITNPETVYHIEGRIIIYSRLNSFLDLEILICATKALRQLTNLNIHFVTGYFLGSRSDRKFEKGGVNYLKEVICPIINSLEFTKVTSMDPHSDVLEACIHNYSPENNYNLIQFALNSINTPSNELCLVSPDAGAYKKIFNVAKTFEIENIITASKVRDLKTGAILRTEVPTLDQHKDFKYIIIDDICDGGRTFIELAKAIKESRPTAKIYLVVTHGIFSAGYDLLGEYFEKIYTTNSYKQISYSDKIKQLDIF